MMREFLAHGCRRIAALALAAAIAVTATAGARAGDEGLSAEAEGALKDLSGLLDSLSKALPEAERFAAASLAQAITDAHDRALPFAQPMPAEIKVELAPFFSTTPWLLDEVRWVTGEEIGGMTDLVMLNPDVTAVTLDNIVVFRDAADAKTNRVLWAHELVHVLQYRTLGVDSFAKEYLQTGGKDLEKEAETFSSQVREKLAASTPTLT